jgi:hypothetical protein
MATYEQIRSYVNDSRGKRVETCHVTQVLSAD